jgi:CHAT domain-containing protein/tetratricopeptide (TPR) repeat protein
MKNTFFLWQILVLVITQNILAQSDTVLARKYFTNADNLYKKAEYIASLEELNKASVIYQKKENWRMFLACQEKITANYIQQGKFEQAQQTAENGLQVASEKLKKDIPEKADLANILGFVQLNKGRNDLALDNFNIALKLYQQFYPEKHSKLATCYSNFGLLYNSTGNHELAAEFLQKSLTIRQQLYGENHEEVADAYNNLGLAFVESDKEKSLDFYDKALAVYQKIYSENHPKTARVYNNTAIVYFQEKDYDSALKNYRKAEQIFQNLYNDSHPNLAFVYSSIGQVFEAQEDYVKALSFQKLALDIYRKNYTKKHYEIANTYNLIGNIYRKQQNYKQALQNYQQALIENSSDFDSGSLIQNPSVTSYYNPMVLLNSLLAKAKTLEDLYIQQSLKKSDLDLSLSTLQSCDKLIDNIRQLRSSKSDKLALGVIASEVYEDAIRISLSLAEIVLNKKDYREQAFYFSEKSKTAVLLESIADSQAKSFANIPDTLLQREKQLKADITFYEQKIAEKADIQQEALFRSKLFTLNRAYETFTKNLEQNFPEYYNLKFNLASVTVSQLQTTIDENTALISYFMADQNHRLYVFYITKKAFHIFDMPRNENADKKLIAFRNAIRNNAPQLFAKTSFELYKSLFPKQLPAFVKKLIIIPDGKLGALPFEALLSKKEKSGNINYQNLSYLIKKFAVSYDYSATLYYQSKQSKPLTEKPQIMLVAPVEFGETANDLPGSESEVNAIAELFRQKGYKSSAYIHHDATEALVKSGSTKKYTFLHFATHGIVNSETPELSQIFFVKDAGQDGSLYAGEIYNCTFNAELVALSACQTGLGKVARGEGIIGLCRALVYAGAKNLLVSLWSVSDKSTAQLTVDFYKNLLENTNSPDFSVAIRQAKLMMLQNKDYCRPYFWAAFILIGK